MASKKIFTAVFSYNRPLHLENCLQSLKDMYPDAHVVVFDDNSPNPAVDEVIQKFDCEVRKGKGGSGRHGGLYDNMQMAYEEAIEGGYDYLLSVQDDLQLVRPVDDRVLADIEDAFLAAPSVFCLDVEFSRSISGGRPTLFVLAGEDAPPAPFRDYLDVSLFHVGRMQAADWSFNLELHIVVSGEKSLSLRASSLGLRRNKIRTSFLMHVPFPDLYRNRFRLPRLSALSKKIFRYEYMSKETIQRMDSRPTGEIAQWRDYLTVADTSWFDRWLLSTKNDAKILQ